MSKGQHGVVALKVDVKQLIDMCTLFLDCLSLSHGCFPHEKITSEHHVLSDTVRGYMYTYVMCACVLRVHKCVCVCVMRV